MFIKVGESRINLDYVVQIVPIEKPGMANVFKIAFCNGDEMWIEGDEAQHVLEVLDAQNH